MTLQVIKASVKADFQKPSFILYVTNILKKYNQKKIRVM
jgi:hypothetical protein